jgi:hypothetical protein
MMDRGGTAGEREREKSEGDEWVCFVLYEDGGSWLARNFGVRPSVSQSDDKALHFEGDNVKCW